MVGRGEPEPAEPATVHTSTSHEPPSDCGRSAAPTRRGAPDGRVEPGYSPPARLVPQPNGAGPATPGYIPDGPAPTAGRRPPLRGAVPAPRRSGRPAAVHRRGPHVPVHSVDRRRRLWRDA